MAEIKWKTQEEMDEEKLEQMLMPSQEEIEKAKRELEIMELVPEVLKELGVTV